MNPKDIIIYQNPGGNQVEVKLENETVWLNQQQIAALFGVERSVATKHIKNVYKDGELAENTTCAKFAQVVKRGFRGAVATDIEYYNLDMILSVGYRVNSKNATAFRIWATGVLKKYLTDGFAVNRQKLEAQQKKLADLTKLIDLIKGGGVQAQIENVAQAREIIGVLADFATGFEVLDNYDNERLDKKGRTAGPLVMVSAEEFLDVIKRRAGDFESPLFGVPLGDGFAGSVGQIYQSFDGCDLYPTLEEKAANLLYLVTKNHSFADGNKRIAATCFIYFLLKNNMLWNALGEKSVDDFALAALTLLIAESRPAEKDTMCRLVITILNKR